MRKEVAVGKFVKGIGNFYGVESERKGMFFYIS